MYKYNISKYNPVFRNSDGRYLKEDWTAISDVGKVFDGKELSVEDYIKTEDAYIKAIQIIMDYIGLSYIKVCDVRKSFEFDMFNEVISKRKVRYTNDILETYSGVEKIKTLNAGEVDLFCRLMLREDIGAKVFYPRKLKVFICYDYLMGINSSKSIEKIIPQIEALGLYVEKL